MTDNSAHTDNTAANNAAANNTADHPHVDQTMQLIISSRQMGDNPEQAMLTGVHVHTGVIDPDTEEETRVSREVSSGHVLTLLVNAACLIAGDEEARAADPADYRAAFKQYLLGAVDAIGDEVAANPGIISMVGLNSTDDGAVAEGDEDGDDSESDNDPSSSEEAVQAEIEQILINLRAENLAWDGPRTSEGHPMYHSIYELVLTDHDAEIRDEARAEAGLPEPIEVAMNRDDEVNLDAELREYTGIHHVLSRQEPEIEWDEATGTRTSTVTLTVSECTPNQAELLVRLLSGRLITATGGHLEVDHRLLTA